MLYEKTTVTPWTLAILRELQTLDCFKQFYLGGWTNLALRFWHRISVDLDFFATSEFNEIQVDLQIRKLFPQAIKVAEKRQSLFYSIDEVKVDILYFPYPNTQDIEVINWLKLLSTQDVIAMKLNAIQKRTTKKDYYDIVEALEHYSISDMLSFYKAKFPNTDIGHIIHMLYMIDEADKDENPITLKSYSRTQVKTVLKKKLNEYINSQL